MKQKFLLLLAVVFSIVATNANAQYIDLSTGKTITVVKHEGKGIMFNPETQRQVHIYVNPATNDTFYGRTGEVINGKVVRTADGGFLYSDDADYVFKEGEYRLKTEADSAGYKKVFQRDGDVKVKHGDYKRKEKLDGDVKEKAGDTKAKVQTNGTLKVKDGNFRAKRDEEGNVRVKDDSTKVKIDNNGSTKAKDKRNDHKSKFDAKDHKIKNKSGVHNRKEKIKPSKIKVKDEGDVETKIDIQ